MGCPVGIGPEIILRYFQNLDRSLSPPVAVIGDMDVLENSARHFAIDIACRPWSPGSPLPADGIPVHAVSNLDHGTLQWGRPTLATGRAMAAYIETAVTLAKADDIAGIVTCPITKSALQKAGSPYPGHTEMLADLCGESSYTMMMAGKNLRITLVSIHCRFSNIIDHLTTESIYRRIQLTHRSLQNDFAIAKPRIAVAGLNPHAGEEGLFGQEEEQIIAPAVAKSQHAGICAEGPLPPDTVFHKAASKHFDAVVCMYHDQGLIPFKLLHFSDGVNVTIGLSLIRTSVDHGTAYDIAGRGIASKESLEAAVDLAAAIAANRKRAAERRLNNES